MKTADELAEFFFLESKGRHESLYKEIENFLSFEDALDPANVDVLRKMSTKLPMFYINFDRSIYFHANFERAHEALVYHGWLAKAADFNLFIPDCQRYWLKDGMDFWKITQLPI